MDLAAKLISPDKLSLMRKTFRIPVFYFLSIASVFSASLAVAEIEPAAQKIFDSYAIALGGEEAYADIETALMGMTMEMPAIGMSMQREVSFKQPNKIYVVMDIPGMGQMKQGYDGEKGWSMDPIQGSRELLGAELEKLLSETDFKEGLKLSENYTSAKVKGRSEDGLTIVECITEQGSHPETLYFEEETGLMQKMETIEDMGEQGVVPVSAKVVSYEKMGDLLMPVHIEAQMMSMSMVMKITSLEPNVPVDETLFSMPE